MRQPARQTGGKQCACTRLRAPSYGFVSVSAHAHLSLSLSLSLARSLSQSLSLSCSHLRPLLPWVATFWVVQGLLGGVRWEHAGCIFLFY